MNRRLVALTIVVACFLTGCATIALAGKGGNGKGKPVAAAAETLPPDTVVDTYPPTTTIPYDPGTPIVGYLIVDGLDELHWGDSVAVTYSYEGTLSNRGEIFVSVVCTQGAGVVYQASNVGDFADGFTFTQQDGLAAIGLLIDTTQPGSCVMDLIYRILNDKDHTYQTLDEVGFEVGAAP